MIKIVEGYETTDGQDVSIYRLIGTTELSEINPFLLLDEFKSENPDKNSGGFPMHPHRGFETVTYCKEGHFKHRDTKGNAGELKSGEVQWMTAGKGLMHEEMPVMDTGRMWGYQLWINLPKEYKMVDPKYRHLTVENIPIIEKDNLKIRLFSGKYDNKEGPAKSYYPVDYMELEFSGGVFEREPNDVNLLYVHTGEVTLKCGDDEVKVPERHMAIIEACDKITITGANAGALYISSKGLDEPVVRYGPYVMNTKEEILQAFKDFNEGN